MARTRPLQPTEVELKMLKNRLRAERENCCDDHVVAKLDNRVDYGRALLAIEELRGRSTVLAVGASDSSLLARVRRIAGLEPDGVASSPWPILSFALGLVGVALMLSLHSFQSLAQTPDDADNRLLETELQVGMEEDAVHFIAEQRLELKRAAAHGDGWFFVDLDGGRFASPPFPVEIDTQRLPYFVIRPKQEVLNAWLVQNGIDLILYSQAKPLGDGSGAMNQHVQIRSVRTNLKSLATRLQQLPNKSWTWKTLPQEVVALFERKDEITHVSGFVPDSLNGEVRADSPVLHPFRTAENLVGLFLLEQPQSLKDELLLRIVHVSGATTPLADVEYATGDFVSGKNGPAEPPGVSNTHADITPSARQQDELGVLHEKFKRVLPRDWTVHRKDRAFEFRGPYGPTEATKSEPAQITLWFSDHYYNSRTLQRRDPKLPRIISWGRTRLGQVLSTRNQAAIEHWPEFGDVLYWLLPNEHIALIGGVDLYQKIDGQSSLNSLIYTTSRSVIDLRIDNDGDRVHNHSRALGEYGISPKTDLVVIGKEPKLDDAMSAQERQRILRQQTQFQLAMKGARVYGVRTVLLEDYITRLRKLKQEGPTQAWKESKDGDRILIPEVSVPLAEQAGSKRPDEFPVVYEGIIDDVLDDMLLLDDGRGIMTGRSTEYARLKDRGEVLAERKDLKFRVRVRYEVVPGVGATKVIILSPPRDGARETIVPSDARKDVAPPANAAHGESEWGDVLNGLRARFVPVLSSMSEDAIDPAQRVEKFATADDVAFAVELENVSDKPIKLLDTRYGATYGDSVGKANSNWYGQFLFSIDLFDRDGKKIERPEVQVVDLNTVLDGALVASLEPGMTHRFLLRPAEWLSAMTQRIEPGSYHAAVRYHGLPARVATRIKEYRPDSPALEAVAGDLVTMPVAFEVASLNAQPQSPANELDDEQRIEFVWGASTNGLRAAMSFAPTRTSHSHGEKPKLKLHVQNSSDQPITLTSLLWLSELPATATNDKGERMKLGSTWYSGRTLAARVMLKPQQMVVFDAGNVGLAITKELAANFEDITNRTFVAPAGKYTMQLQGRFGDSFTLKDGNGKVLAPLEGDWIGELKTGVTPFEITNETIECNIVDAVTEEPVAGTTVNFRFIKPKSGDDPEEIVADVFWGPQSPSRIVFGIPEDVLQRADRDEIEVEWSVGGHADYEPYARKERIPLKPFFHEGPKAARETLGTIKLTKKEKKADGVPEKRIQFRLLGGDHAVPLPDVEGEVTNYSRSVRERVGQFRTDEAGIAQVEPPPGGYRLQLTSDKELPYLLVDNAWNKEARGPRPLLLFSVSDAEVRKWEGERYVAPDDSSDPWQVTFTLLPACELELQAIDVDTGDGVPGVEFFRENPVGEDWAHPIPGENLGWQPVAGGTKFGAAGNSTNRDGIFRRLVGANAGFIYGIWRTPADYEEVEPRRDVEIDIVYGQRKAEHVFKLQRIRKPVDAQGADKSTMLVPGQFAGFAQTMQIGPEDSISYSDAKGLCQMTLFEDDRLKVAFRNESEILTEVTLPLVIGAAGQQRAAWSAELDGYVYRATAIPFSTRGCLFRLEKRRDDKLVHGSLQYFAVESRQGDAKHDAPTTPIDHRQWRVDQSGTGVVAGSYTGASQRMQIAEDGAISYADRPHGICHLSVSDDNRLTAAFRDARGMPTEITLPLVTTAAEQRASWSAEVDGHTLRATAIPYSDNVYVFRLEKLRDGKLIDGEEQFYAIDQKLRKATPEERAEAKPAS